MLEDMAKRIYRRKHFYKVTWTRSEQLLKETPWLKPDTHDFCMIGYRQPTLQEAEDFIGSTMYDRLFDKVTAVEEISRDEALENFQMDNWRYQKVFGAGERKKKASLDDQMRSASARAGKSCEDFNAKEKDFVR